jgi:hypothetical protein
MFATGYPDRAPCENAGAMADARDHACPYLGLPDDPRTRFAFATQAHRCFAKRRSAPITLSHQGSFCLTAAFPTCDRFPDRAPIAATASTTPTVSSREMSAVAAEAPDPAARERLLRRTPVINVGPRTLPTPRTGAEPIDPPAAVRGRRAALGVLLLLALLTAIAVAAANDGVAGLRAQPGPATPSASAHTVLSATA